MKLTDIEAVVAYLAQRVADKDLSPALTHLVRQMHDTVITPVFGKTVFASVVTEALSAEGCEALDLTVNGIREDIRGVVAHAEASKLHAVQKEIATLIGHKATESSAADAWASTMKALGQLVEGSDLDARDKLIDKCWKGAITAVYDIVGLPAPADIAGNREGMARALVAVVDVAIKIVQLPDSKLPLDLHRSRLWRPLRANVSDANTFARLRHGPNARVIDIEAFHDLQTHRKSWTAALEKMATLARVNDDPAIDEAGYWRHEKEALEKLCDYFDMVAGGIQTTGEWEGFAANAEEARLKASITGKPVLTAEQQARGNPIPDDHWGNVARPTVVAFATAIENRLRNHDVEKGIAGWKTAQLWVLEDMLKGAIAKLDRLKNSSALEYAAQAADVGALVMMCADRHTLYRRSLGIPDAEVTYRPATWQEHEAAQAHPADRPQRNAENLSAPGFKELARTASLKPAFDETIDSVKEHFTEDEWQHLKERHAQILSERAVDASFRLTLVIANEQSPVGADCQTLAWPVAQLLTTNDVNDKVIADVAAWFRERLPKIQTWKDKAVEQVTHDRAAAIAVTHAAMAILESVEAVRVEGQETVYGMVSNAPKLADALDALRTAWKLPIPPKAKQDPAEEEDPLDGREDVFPCAGDEAWVRNAAGGWRTCKVLATQNHSAVVTVALGTMEVIVEPAPTEKGTVLVPNTWLRPNVPLANGLRDRALEGQGIEIQLRMTPPDESAPKTEDKTTTFDAKTQQPLPEGTRMGFIAGLGAVKLTKDDEVAADMARCWEARRTGGSGPCPSFLVESDGGASIWRVQLGAEPDDTARAAVLPMQPEVTARTVSRCFAALCTLVFGTDPPPGTKLHLPEGAKDHYGRDYPAGIADVVHTSTRSLVTDHDYVEDPNRPNMGCAHELTQSSAPGDGAANDVCGRPAVDHVKAENTIDTDAFNAELRTLPPYKRVIFDDSTLSPAPMGTFARDVAIAAAEGEDLVVPEGGIPLVGSFTGPDAWATKGVLARAGENRGLAWNLADAILQATADPKVAGAAFVEKAQAEARTLAWSVLEGDESVPSDGVLVAPTKWPPGFRGALDAFEQCESIEDLEAALDEAPTEMAAVLRKLRSAVYFGARTIHGLWEPVDEELPPSHPRLGDKVRKPEGIAFDGVVVGTALTTQGKQRFLVESEAIPGLLHVYSADNLEVVARVPESKLKHDARHQELLAYAADLGTAHAKIQELQEQIRELKQDPLRGKGMRETMASLESSVVEARNRATEAEAARDKAEAELAEVDAVLAHHRFAAAQTRAMKVEHLGNVAADAWRRIDDANARADAAQRTAETTAQAIIRWCNGEAKSLGNSDVETAVARKVHALEVQFATHDAADPQELAALAGACAAHGFTLSPDESTLQGAVYTLHTLRRHIDQPRFDDNVGKTGSLAKLRDLHRAAESDDGVGRMFEAVRWDGRGGHGPFDVMPHSGWVKALDAIDVPTERPNVRSLMRLMKNHAVVMETGSTALKPAD